jgi:hypothetical protein
MLLLLHPAGELSVTTESLKIAGPCLRRDSDWASNKPSNRRLKLNHSVVPEDN